MRLSSTFATLAIFAASTSAAVIDRRQLIGITNGGTPDVFTSSSQPTRTTLVVPPSGASTIIDSSPIATNTPPAGPTIIDSSPIATITPPTGTTTIIDIFPTDTTCADAEAQKGSYQGLVNDPVCSFMVDDCVKTVASSNTPFYSINSCAVAATCDGVANVLQLAKCSQPSLAGVAQSQLPNLDFSIYADIAGDCAWIPESQGGACPITRQNYIDWFYRTLTELNTPVWPDVDTVIEKFWMPIRSWTNTGETIPYLNFNDWLHWSN
ncbi:hypothetical protein D9758_012082 [Tetrapyrgos nigripes]|uniref:Uncharacterized protein n=1 Tax=Tetrapyrgos nigripes TaxID=182062 RepID=A0A8H5FJ92_9AGAR|nr:hypothetical protein D9758_012082 [Tetrapyrgos nigripes]